jgi:hypothetical protein
MALRSVTAGAIDGFSTRILASTHVPSSHLSILNTVFSKINLLAIANSPFMLLQAMTGPRACSTVGIISTSLLLSFFFHPFF